MTRQTTVGFVGLGDMGGPIARRIIAAGFPTVLWARREASLEPYRNCSQVICAPSLQALGAACDVVGVCVFGDDDVNQVIDGGGEGLLHGMAPGGVIVIHSTVSLESCERLAALASERGVGLLDAPVSGARQGAEAGTLAIMAGGDAEAFEKALPVFASYGKTIERLGPIGSGQRCKVLNNALCNANVAMAAIAFDIGERMGLDRETLHRMLLNSSGRSFGMECLVSMLMPDPEFSAHALNMLEKDTALFEAVCRARGIAPTLLDSALEEERDLIKRLAGLV